MRYDFMPDAIYMPCGEYARSMRIPFREIRQAVVDRRIRVRNYTERLRPDPYIHVRSANTWAAKYRSI